MIPQKLSLGKGVTLYAIETDRFKTACLTASLLLPADKAASPMRSLLLSVMEQGTKNDPSLRALNRRMDLLYALTLYASNSRMGDLQLIGSGAYFLNPAFLPASEDRARVEQDCVDMLADSLYAPLFTRDGFFRSDYTERGKTVQIDQIRDERNSPSAYAAMRSREITFKGTPHAVSFSGNVDQVRAITREELSQLYRELIPHAPVQFFYIGSTAPAEIAERLERALRLGGPSPATDGSLSAPMPPLPACNRFSDVIRTEESLAVSQGKLVMTFLTGTTVASPDFYAAMVYNEILGGSPVSKLFVNVREKKSLSYQCSSYQNSYKGYLTVFAGIRCDKKDEAEAEILLQVEEMRQGHITKSEFDAAVRALLSMYVSVSDSASALEKFYTVRSLYRITATPEDVIAALSAVTLADVTAFAQKVTLRSVYFLRPTETEALEEESE
jgi:predicted Zn-dependent peptidase